MTFFFSLPQTLLRQLATDPGKSETNYMFVPESKNSRTGRSNSDNLRISQNILKSVNPQAEITIYDEKVALETSINDGIGDELLRGESIYGWKFTGRCQYVIQHSCYGWESTNLYALFRPFQYLRAIRRSSRRFMSAHFKELFVYYGSENTSENIRQTIRPWKSTRQISHSDLSEICSKFVRVYSTKSMSRNSKEKSSGKHFLFLAAGSCQLQFERVMNLAKLHSVQVVLKQHPQQSMEINSDYVRINHHQIVLEDRNMPAELLVTKYQPSLIFGPPSTIQFFAKENYMVYRPSEWKQAAEAALLDDYRQSLRMK